MIPDINVDLSKGTQSGEQGKFNCVAISSRLKHGGRGRLMARETHKKLRRIRMLKKLTRLTGGEKTQKACP